MVTLNSRASQSLASGQLGQATLEYILLISIIVGFFLKAMGILSNSGWVNTLVAGPLSNDFLPAYQYGHPGAKGYTDAGWPKYHPRAIDQPPPGNFRIFYVQPQ